MKTAITYTRPTAGTFTLTEGVGIAGTTGTDSKYKPSKVNWVVGSLVVAVIANFLLLLLLVCPICWRFEEDRCNNV